MTYITSWERDGMEIGALKNAREMARGFLTARFDEIDKAVLDQLDQLPIEKLHTLPKAFLTFSSIDDVRAWLKTEDS